MNKKSISASSVKLESFTKAQRLVHPTDVSDPRSFVFDPTKQRNVAFLNKGISKPGAISYNVLRQAAKSVHIARICINVLKQKVTKTKWVIKPTDPQQKADGDERIEQLTELFKHPNQDGDTFRTILDKMLEDLLVLDSVSLEKTRYEDGTLAGIHFVDSATIRPVFDEHGHQDIPIPLSTTDGMEELPVSYVQIKDNSQYGGPESGEIEAAWPKRDFINFHMYPQGSMESIGYGLSPLEGVLSVVANILNADNYNGTYFEEGSFPPVIIHITGQVNQRDIESYRTYLQSELNGNFHRPAIMAGGSEMNVVNLKDLTNNDMQFMQYMLFMSKLLSVAYGLSPDDIGLTDTTSGKNVADNNKTLSDQKGYSSILHLLKEIFNQEIIHKDFGYDDLEFEWVADDTTSEKDKGDIVKTALETGMMTINEGRQKLGLQPYEKWADKPVILTANGFVDLEDAVTAPTPTDVVGEDKDEPVKGDEKPDDKGSDGKAKQKEPEGKKKEVGGERNYSTQSNPSKKSMFKQMWERVAVRKSTAVEPTPQQETIEQNYEQSPVMFGQLVTDEPLKKYIQALFKEQKLESIMALGFESFLSTYRMNEATTALRAFIDKNPNSFAGIVPQKDMNGLCYWVYTLNNE